MTGPGLGLRTAVGNAEESIGLLYTGMFVDDESTSTELDAHALYVDFDTTLTLPDGPQGLALRAAAGLGVASMGFGDARFDDVQTGAANLRIDMQFAPTPGLALGFGVGGFVYGFPGETEAYGSFMQLGLRLTF